jgi:hypothetical protein
MASAVMLCVADAVETLQGNTDPTTYVSKARSRQEVCSYGNLLFCDWLNDPDGRQQARFRWGNATTYTQFFVDYERFLERPPRFAVKRFLRCRTSGFSWLSSILPSSTTV